MRFLFSALALAGTLLAAPVAARDDGRYANTDPKIKAWIKGLKSAASGQQGCCDVSDGHPPEAVWDMGNGRYRVMIEGKSYDVPDDAVITEPNRLGYAVVWFYWSHDERGKQPVIRCFMAGSGG